MRPMPAETPVHAPESRHVRRPRHAVAIAACTATLTAASEVQLFPAGAFRGVDGRPEGIPHWRIDATAAQRVMALAAGRANRFTIDYEHQTLLAEKNGQPAPAAGFFKRLEWREGKGLYATDVEWTARAKAMIEAGEYRYFSPVFRFDTTSGEVLELLMGAITNTAAIDGMDAVAAAAKLFRTEQPEEETRMTLLQKLIADLGLPEATTEEQAVAACTALKVKADAAATDIAAAKAAAPDPARFVPVETMRDLQTQLAAARSEATKREVADLVDPALADGRLLPAQEKWARELGQKDVAALKSYLETAQPIAALKATQTGGKPPAAAQAGGTALSADELAVCRAMSLDPKDYAAAKAA